MRQLAVVVVVGFVWAGGAWAELDSKAARIGRDIVANLGGTPAFDALREVACSDASVKAQLGQVVTKEFDCSAAGSSSGGAGGVSESIASIAYAEGTWSTRGAEGCRTHWYSWVVSGALGMSEFKDSAGQFDIERTVEVKEDAIVTETMASHHPRDGKREVTGTRWRYVFVDREHVRVQNLRTGAGFSLTRC